jgi:hypothetical protein
LGALRKIEIVSGLVGTVVFFPATQPLFHPSLGVNWRDHNFLPEVILKAIIESEVSVGGSE